MLVLLRLVGSEACVPPLTCWGILEFPVCLDCLSVELPREVDFRKLPAHRGRCCLDRGRWSRGAASLQIAVPAIVIPLSLFPSDHCWNSLNALIYPHPARPGDLFANSRNRAHSEPCVMPTTTLCNDHSQKEQRSEVHMACKHAQSLKGQQLAMDPPH